MVSPFQILLNWRELLLSVKSEQVARNLVERLLSYALCRELEWFDEVTVDTIVEKLIKIGENGSRERKSPFMT